MPRLIEFHIKEQPIWINPNLIGAICVERVPGMKELEEKTAIVVAVGMGRRYFVDEDLDTVIGRIEP